MTSSVIEHTEPMPRSSIERLGIDHCRSAALGMARHIIASALLEQRLVKCIQKADPDNPDQVLFQFSVEVLRP